MTDTPPPEDPTPHTPGDEGHPRPWHGIRFPWDPDHRFTIGKTPDTPGVGHMARLLLHGE